MKWVIYYNHKTDHTIRIESDSTAEVGGGEGQCVVPFKCYDKTGLLYEGACDKVPAAFWDFQKLPQEVIRLEVMNLDGQWLKMQP